MDKKIAAIMLDDAIEKYCLAHNLRDPKDIQYVQQNIMGQASQDIDMLVRRNVRSGAK